MKIFLIIVAALIMLFIIYQIYSSMSQRNIEQYPYELIKRYDQFEIRKYEASLFTTVKIGSKKYKEASSQGFSILAGYIFGGNETNEKIAMTSPVAMSLEDSMEVMFMVPKDYNKTSLPKPNQKNIEFKEEPTKTVAAITFGGWANDEKIAHYKQKLVEAIKAKGLQYTNRFFFLGYNPPYEIINRKNEIIVELDASVPAS